MDGREFLGEGVYRTPHDSHETQGENGRLDATLFAVNFFRFSSSKRKSRFQRKERYAFLSVGDDKSRGLRFGELELS